MYRKAANHGANDLHAGFHTTTFENCIEHCSSTPKCVVAQFARYNNMCRLRSHGIERAPEANVAYDSAYLIP
ncbi:hypothetical protein BDW66DRAFT_138455 [Aspergillus desertorum]